MASSDDDACIQHVVAASVAENEGIELDRAGDVRGAIQKYEECERKLAAAIAAALPGHAEDHPKLVQHRKEIIDRLGHLNSLKGKPSTIPVDQQIRAVQLSMQAAGAATAATASAGGTKTLAACAALGAAGGFLILGSTVGPAISIVGGAAGAAYVATRQDKAGEVARGAGSLAVKGADKVVELNKEHKVTEKLADAGSKAVGAAKAVDVKYGISGKVATGVGTMVSKAQEVEEKHHVTDKVASGVSAGLGRIASMLDKVARRASQSSSAQGSAAPSGGGAGA